MKIKEALAYDDVLLVPKYSTIKTRSLVSTKVKIKDLEFSHPIVPANMKTIIGQDLAEQIIMSGGLAILHRFESIDEQLKKVEYLTNKFGNNNLAISIGVKENEILNVDQFARLGVKIFCIDIAHGDSLHCVEMIEQLKNRYPNSLVIAGNVATAQGAKNLWLAGADIVKSNVGSGSICSTRIETGNGLPGFQSLVDISFIQKELEEIHNERFYLMADGGCKTAGDIVKSLCFADMSMVGNIFAGCSESPGSIVYDLNGHKYKKYEGSSTHRGYHTEGVKALVHEKGDYLNILSSLLESVRSACSYQGVDNLIDLREDPEFVRITSAGLKESHPHDVILQGSLATINSK